MWGRIITLLTIVAGLIQQWLKHRDKKNAEIEGKANEEELKNIERDPAEWFANHFGEGTTVVVRPRCDHDDELLHSPTDVPTGTTATETGANNRSDRRRGDVPGP